MARWSSFACYRKKSLKIDIVSFTNWSFVQTRVFSLHITYLKLHRARFIKWTVVHTSSGNPLNFLFMLHRIVVAGSISLKVCCFCNHFSLWRGKDYLNMRNQLLPTGSRCYLVHRWTYHTDRLLIVYLMVWFKRRLKTQSTQVPSTPRRRNLKTRQSPFWICVSGKLEQGNHMPGYRDCILFFFQTSRFQKCFLSSILKHKADIFKFLWSDERFRKAPFS